MGGQREKQCKEPNIKEDCRDSGLSWIINKGKGSGPISSYAMAWVIECNKNKKDNHKPIKSEA